MAPRATRSVFLAFDAFGLHPAWLFSTGSMFFFMAWIFSSSSGDAAEATSSQTWGLMVSHAFYGIVSFAVGIRMLSVRSFRRRLEQHFKLSETSSASSADEIRGQVDAMVEMKVDLKLALMGLGLLIQAGILWAAGNEDLAYFTLLPIALGLIGLLISCRVDTPKRRELLANVTDSENAQLDVLQRMMKKKYLPIMVINFALGGAAYYASDRSVSSIILIALLVYVVLLAVVYRLSAPWRQFLRETEFAKARSRQPA